MKKVFLKKARLTGAIMVATVGMVAGTVVQADSLLAPVVMSDTVAGYETYFAFKMKGKNGVNSDNIHYTWIKKGTSVRDLFRTSKPCIMENNMGKGSKGDMIYQSVRVPGLAYTGDGMIDNSRPAVYGAGNFVGMTVITDTVNSPTPGGSGTPEGDMSGFAYIVNPAIGVYQDYKLLNNHRSAEDGNFAAGFISKHVIDFMWLGPRSIGVNPPSTGWTMSVTGPDMAKHSGTYNSTYGLTVKVSQAQRTGEDSPQNAVVGAYDNDETVISGDKPLNVTCMASFTRSAFLTPLQVFSTQDGGWTRKSIIPQADAYTAGGTDTAKIARGAITYRADTARGIPGPSTTMQVETGGHLSPGVNNHANRPY